jgi:hypothetical protein
LLRYLSDAELRRMIQAATNKSKRFNQFVQWVSFGGDSVIAENTRDKQGLQPFISTASVWQKGRPVATDCAAYRRLEKPRTMRLYTSITTVKGSNLRRSDRVAIRRRTVLAAGFLSPALKHCRFTSSMTALM